MKEVTLCIAGERAEIDSILHLVKSVHFLHCDELVNHSFFEDQEEGARAYSLFMEPKSQVQ